ncbi:MAG: hypothetical protein KF893_00190 [Caldilineaceae bacterium]|nr:hypothetical protein [Caldilineaceae bacterium]
MTYCYKKWLCSSLRLWKMSAHRIVSVVPWQAYLRTWAAELNVSDLLEQALIEATREE